MHSLSQSTHDRIVQLRKELHVLQEIDAHAVTGVCRTVVITCPDGHQISDLLNHHHAMCGGNKDTMHHPIALNGGALLLPKCSPLLVQPDGRRSHDDEVIARHLEMTVRLKDPQAVILYTHVPCGMAELHGLSIDEQIRLAIEAKMVARHQVSPLGITDIRLWLHVCYNNGRRRTYHVNREAYAHATHGSALSLTA